MRTLIAGCGYVGCALAELLLDAGHSVSGLRRNTSALPDGVTPLAADLSDPASLRRALSGARYDWVVYAAAADGRDERAYRRAYVEGLSHVLDAVDVPERLVFTSSTAVYGQSDGETVDEGSATMPAGFNGQIMLEAEEIVGTYVAETVSLRFGGIYGPTRTRLVDAVREQRVELPAGPRLSNRIHRDDCAGAIAHVLRISKPAATYVAVDDEPADMREVYTWLADRLGVQRPPTSEDAPPSPGKRCSNASLRASGYVFLYPSFREGYEDVITSG